MGFLRVLKINHVRLFIFEKVGFGTLSYASETLAAYAGMCLCTHALAHIRKP